MTKTKTIQTLMVLAVFTLATQAVVAQIFTDKVSEPVKEEVQEVLAGSCGDIFNPSPPPPKPPEQQA